VARRGSNPWFESEKKEEQTARVILSGLRECRRLAVPLYEYACQKCFGRTEKIESVSGPHLKKCPRCGGKVERLLSSPAIQFKGSGWYVTDYAGKSAKPEAAKSESSAKDGAGKETGAKESAAKEAVASDGGKEKKSKK
jgi:putative FmdB family regulatory protein